jgi:hypothetical protein
MVHSCLVLQHIPPAIALRYVAEFFRVCRPGGLVVFQVPAMRWTEDELLASHALPDSAFAASIAVEDPPHAVEASAFATLTLRVTNRSDMVWRHDIPAGRHICVGNHWLLEDGTTVVSDDARAFLPRRIEPGETVEMQLKVQAPAAPGRYLLEVDLVQEHICWFSQKGSPAARVAVTVAGTTTRGDTSRSTRAETPVLSQPGGPPRPTLFRRVLRRLRGGTPTFEMHIIPRELVENTIRESGGTLIRAVDDNAAGAGWLSYTYICRKH